MITDRMRINHSDTDSLPDYGSLFLRHYDERTRVNDYGGADEGDVDKLDLLTNAAVGSTCLFSNGNIYMLTFDGWLLFGEETATVEGTSSESSNSAANTTEFTPTLSPLNLDRNALTGSADLGDDQTVETLDFEPETVEEITAIESEETTLNAPENAVTGESDEVV